VERIVAQLRAVWPDVRIMLRADAGFCRDALLTRCEAHAVDYVIGPARNARLTAGIADALTDVWIQCVETDAPARYLRT